MFDSFLNISIKPSWAWFVFNIMFGGQRRDHCWHNSECEISSRWKKQTLSAFVIWPVFPYVSSLMRGPLLREITGNLKHLEIPFRIGALKGASFYCSAQFSSLHTRWSLCWLQSSQRLLSPLTLERLTEEATGRGLHCTTGHVPVTTVIVTVNTPQEAVG